MAYNRIQAKRLCSASEYELFLDSLSDSIDTLDRSAVGKSIKRTRTLRDKNNDLHQRQSLSSRDSTGSKTGTSGVSNARTEQKARLFAEVLRRYEDRLEHIDTIEHKRAQREVSRANRAEQSGVRKVQREAAAKARKSPAAQAKSGPAADTGYVSLQAKENRFKQDFQESNTQPIQGHLSSRNRRDQGKRDQR